MNTDQPEFRPTVQFETPEQRSEFFQGLSELDRACKGNGTKHDRITALICACIDAGVNTATQITGTLKRLGFNRQHVGLWLTRHTGSDPERYHCARHNDGRYANLI